jgi:hypothetical protein
MMPISELSVLHGIRMQLDALIAEKEAEAQASHPQPDPEACPNCGAPAEKQVSSSTMGEPKIMCLMCRQERAA